MSAVDFRLTEDQEALRKGFRELLARRFPRERLRAAADHAPSWGAGLDRGLWRALGEAGLFVLRLEEDGSDGGPDGVGVGLPEAVLVFEEAGRALLPGPLVATHLAVTHLLGVGVGSDAGAGLGVSAGAGLGAGLGVDAGVGAWAADSGIGAAGSAGRADSAGGARSSGGAGSSDSGAGRIGGAAGGIAGVEAAGAVVAAARGEAVVTALDVRGARGGGTAPTALIEHLSSADAVLVVGEDDTDVRMAAVGEFATSGHGAPDAPVARDAHGAVGETGALHTVDPATPLHRVALAPRRRGGVAARAERSAATQQAPAPRSAVLRREAALLTAAQQLGSASCTVGTAVRYAGEREQFGRPIGAFQAVKHLCAQMLVRAEIARSAVYAAAVTGDAYDIAAAKLLADDAAVRNARDCLQVHGGMGFTWEADVHLHLKRAWVRSGQWQSAAEAEELLADSLVGRRMSRQKAPSTECPNDSHEFG